MLNIATRDHTSRIKSEKKENKKTPIVRQVILAECLFNDENTFRQESFVSLPNRQKFLAENAVKQSIFCE